MLFGFMPMGGLAAPFEVDESKPWHQRLAGYRYSIQPYATIPQALADAWTEVMVEACRGFHEEDYQMQPALDYVDDLTDEQVDKRIAGFQKGYDKEFDRRAVNGAWGDMEPDEKGVRDKLRYVFADLPVTVQRAVVSHWDRLHHEWLAEHPLIHYEPRFGYFWLIEGSVIKMFEDIDHYERPTEENVIGWESMGAPGGMYGWAATAAAREAGDMEPIYTAYGDFED